MRNKENYNAKKADYMKNRSVQLKLKAVKYKGGKCIKCGYDRCYAALQFHHRDPTQKEMNWNKLRSQRWSFIEKELDKCDLLCGNCHVEEHFDEFILKRVQEWEKRIKERPKVKGTRGSCAYCKKEFTRSRHDKKKKYCTLQCSHKGHEKINWPEQDDLKKRVKEHGILKVSKSLGISDNAVRRRIKRKSTNT